MKKIALMLVAVLMAVSVAACGTEKPAETTAVTTEATTEATTEVTTEATTEATTETQAALDLQSVENAVIEAVGEENYLSTVSLVLADVAESYGLDASQIKDSIMKESTITSVYLDSLIVLQCEEGYTETAVSVLNDTYAGLCQYSALYPFAAAKVQNARLYRVDNTVIFVLAGAEATENMTEEDAADLAVAEYEKIDAALEALLGTELENLAVVPEIESGDSGAIGGLFY